MREKDDLDLLIDSALATYADPGPDSGLEDRLLVGLSAVRTETHRYPSACAGVGFPGPSPSRLRPVCCFSGSRQ